MNHELIHLLARTPKSEIIRALEAADIIRHQQARIREAQWAQYWADTPKPTDPRRDYFAEDAITMPRDHWGQIPRSKAKRRLRRQERQAARQALRCHADII